ncbi:MAG: hypothetical protein ABIP90_06250, partial [Vicinamibacterales bacterium]
MYRRASGFTRVFALTLLALTAAAFCSWRVAAAGRTDPSDFYGWVFSNEASHDSDEAVFDDVLGFPTYPGCEGVTGIPIGTDPAWVRVGLSTNPNTPFVEARGQLLRSKPSDTDFANPRITWKDTTTNHWSMDINAYLTLDPDYRHLLSRDEFSGTMDIEWERGGVPMYAWPSTGDRMSVWGTHIWDCGHGDTYFGGDYFFKTEIHAPVGWVVYRNTADADHLPDSEAKRTRDWVWYDSGDLQGSAATLLSTGTLNTPVHATVADAFFSSFGGNTPESVNGCDTNLEFQVLGSCTQSNEWRQNVLQQPYTFFVPAPAKPAGDPVMIWESEDRCGDVPTDPANPPNDDPEDVGDAGPLSSAHDIGSPTCSMSESIQQGVDQNNHPGIWVTVNGTPTTYPANNYVAFAKRYKVAWDFIFAPHLSARQIRVDFNTLRVYDDGEPCGEDGEWLLALAANEGWVYPVRGSGDGGDPFWEFGAVDDRLCIDSGEYQDYAINAGVNIIAAHDQPIVFVSGGFESDIALTLFNDIIPWLHEVRDVGTFTSSLATGADGPKYKVIYTISDVSLPPPTPGALTTGSPSYGPNADTGGQWTRVSKLTPIQLEGSDATQLEFRYWKEGEAKPTTWGLDTDDSDGLKVDLSGASDGRYFIEFAPVSANGIVGVRRLAGVELDSTPPVLVVPDDMVLDATSAAGRTVAYVVTAVDALPGPVTLSCSPASGSFFAIQQVTTVNCSAKDSVENESTDSFTVEVVSPFGYIPDFVVLGRQWANIATSVIVQTGNIGAFDASTGVPGSSGMEVVLGASAILTGGPKVAGQSVRLQSGTQAGNVYAVDPVQVGSGATYTAKSGYVPLFLGMPTVPGFGAGTVDKTFSGLAKVLAPGSYGKLKLSPNAVVTLTGGAYYFASVDIGSNAQLLFSVATNVHVTGRVTVGNSAKLLPAAGSSILARDVVFWVTGTDGSSSAFQTSNNV